MTVDMFRLRNPKTHYAGTNYLPEGVTYCFHLRCKYFTSQKTFIYSLYNLSNRQRLQQHTDTNRDRSESDRHEETKKHENKQRIIYIQFHIPQFARQVPLIQLQYFSNRNISSGGHLVFFPCF